jgi:putative ABC transport system permease protein
MLFRGFPLVKQNDRLVYLQERYPSNVCCISYPDFEDWRAQAQTFDGLAYVGARDISFRDRDGRPLDTVAFTVSANTFGLLGVAPVLGRDFTPADEDAGAAPVVILNYRFWESRFGKDANVVGSIVHVSGEPATVIGIMPERFDFPTREDLWMPLTQTPQLWQRGLTPRGFTAVGRLRDGVTPQEARAEIETINRRLEADHPATNRNLIPTVVAHWQMTSGAYARIIWGSVWAGACFVLLVACANLANLVLVRTLGRWREFSTRMALGAGQGRMARQVLLETLSLPAPPACLAGGSPAGP